MSRIVIVTDNTMGIPGGEIDDGLALLYLLGCDEAPAIDAICCTHGNDSTVATTLATRRLVTELGLDIPVIRGLDAGTSGSTEAAERLVTAARSGDEVGLLSLGATSDLALAERLAPGTLASFSNVSIMGGLTGSLVVGGRIMDELNLSVDADATMRVLRSASCDASRGRRSNLLIADAQDCLPLIFLAHDFEGRMSSLGPCVDRVIKRCLHPWFERTAHDWGVCGFVGWDVLAAVAVARPDLVDLVPYEVSLNGRLVAVGLLAEVVEGQGPTASVRLVRIRDVEALVEHIYQCWARAFVRLLC